MKNFIFIFLSLGFITISAFAEEQTAIFAGGCFWCMQGPFDKLDGVLATKAGYTGGTKENPTYEETSSGRTGHRESVEVKFDSKKVTYKKLLDTFWENIDPLDSKGQFCDQGEQYTSAVFYLNDEQKKIFESSKAELEKQAKFKGKIETKILPAKKFYAAEDYHQAYYKKNPVRYNYYRTSCGRDKRLKELWGKSH
jgi:peptide-methionine (S)-S-oxide reductase